jgi:hypothetical protein
MNAAGRIKTRPNPKSKATPDHTITKGYLEVLNLEKKLCTTKLSSLITPNKKIIKYVGPDFQLVRTKFHTDSNIFLSPHQPGLCRPNTLLFSTKGILPLINFGRQILSLEISYKIFWFVWKKMKQISPKNFLCLWRHCF